MAPPEKLEADTVDDCEDLINQEVLKSAREHAKSMGLRLLRGVPYLDFMPFEAILDCMENKLGAYPDDVFCCGLPRSGNRWTFEVVNMVLTQSATFTPLDLLTKMLEFGNPDEFMPNIPRPRQLATHLRLSFLPEKVLVKRSPIIYIVRNPKDALISWYRLLSNLKGQIQFRGSWEEYFEIMLKGELPWGNWFDHVLDAEKFIQQHPDYPLFVLQYEKMKEKPAEVIGDLCTFLGLPTTLVEDIAKQTTMKTMTEGTKEKVDKVNGEWFQKPILHLKGEVGHWKDQFTVEQNERFDKMFERKMAGSQLAARVKPYIMKT